MDEGIKVGGNEEIEAALKEFKAKSAIEQLRPVVKTEIASDLPKMVQLVVKFSGGYIKDEKQANYVLFGLVILMFALTFYFLFSGGDKTKPLPVDLQQIDQRQFVR